MKQVCICQKRFPNSLPFDHVKYVIQSWFPICNEFLNFPPKQKPLNVHLKLLNLCSSKVDHRIISLNASSTFIPRAQRQKKPGPWISNQDGDGGWSSTDPPLLQVSSRFCFFWQFLQSPKTRVLRKKSDTFHQITNPKFRTLNRIFYQGSAPSILGTLSLKPKPHHNVSWLHNRWAKQQRSMMIWGVRRCLCEHLFLKTLIRHDTGTLSYQNAAVFF